MFISGLLVVANNGQRWFRDIFEVYGRIGAFSKSSFVGLGHREATFKDEFAIAARYAQAYIEMGFTPLYFGATTLEDVARELDWRFNVGKLNELSERLKERYQYAFVLPS